MYHDSKSVHAAKTVKLKDGRMFRVEDYYDRVFVGHNIKSDHGSATALEYQARREKDGLPDDTDVLYGKFGITTAVIHTSEIEPPPVPEVAEEPIDSTEIKEEKPAEE